MRREILLRWSTALQGAIQKGAIAVHHGAKLNRSCLRPGALILAGDTLLASAYDPGGKNNQLLLEKGVISLLGIRY